MKLGEDHLKARSRILYLAATGTVSLFAACSSPHDQTGGPADASGSSSSSGSGGGSSSGTSTLDVVQ